MGTSSGTQYRQPAANYATPSGAEWTQSVLNMSGSTTITLSAYTGSGTTLPTANSAVVAKDTSTYGSVPLIFNGVQALLFGAGNNAYTGPDVAPGSSFTASGTSLAGYTPTGLGLNTMTPQIYQPAASNGKISYTDLELTLLGMFVNSRGDPDYMAISPQDNNTVTNLLLNAAGTRVVLNQSDALGNVTASARVTKFVNPTTGKMINVVLWPMLQQGTIIFGSKVLPYPVAGFDGPVMKVITNQDYLAYDFPPTLNNPVYGAMGVVDETLEIGFLGGFAAITGIVYGTS